MFKFSHKISSEQKHFILKTPKFCVISLQVSIFEFVRRIKAIKDFQTLKSFMIPMPLHKTIFLFQLNLKMFNIYM